jgi:hypothetical protein
MSQKKNAGGRPPGIRYPRRFMIYETERGLELLQSIAKRWDTSQAEAVRRLIRQEAARSGIQVQDEYS